MPLTKEFLKQLRDMAEKATGGRWFYDGICYLFTEEADGNNRMIADDRETTRMRGTGANLPLEKNAELICALRNNIIPLLDEIERLQAENERLKKEIDFAYKPL